MRILLVKPRVESDGIQPALGLGFLASGLREKNEVLIVNCLRENLPPKKFGKFAAAFAPDVAGLQVLSTDIGTACSYLTALQEASPGTIRVVGGPHPSSVGAEAFRDLPAADFAFQGEAEIGFPRLLAELEVQSSRLKVQREEKENRVLPLTFDLSPSNLEKIPGLICRVNGDVRANPPVFVDDLDSLGLPAWDLLQPESYPPAPHGGFFRQFPVAPINISRGCPCRCSFCSVRKVSGGNIRYRSLEVVRDEIRLLARSHGIREIHIIDDNFTWDRAYALNFCEQLRRAELSLTWTCPNGVRADTLDRELLESMKAAGCYSLSVAIESGSNASLNRLNKNISTELIEEKVELIKKSGMEVIGFFILGLPGEDLQDLENTIDFSLRLGLRRAQFAFLHPFPGSEIYEKLAPEIRSRLDRFDEATYADPVFSPSGISLPEMKSRQRRAFLRFYLRPRPLWNMISDIKSFRQMYYLARRIRRWLIR